MILEIGRSPVRSLRSLYIADLEQSLAHLEQRGDVSKHCLSTPPPVPRVTRSLDHGHAWECIHSPAALEEGAQERRWEEELPHVWTVYSLFYLFRFPS